MKKSLVLALIACNPIKAVDLPWKAAAEVIRNASLTIKNTLHNDELLYKKTADDLDYFDHALTTRQEHERSVIACVEAQYEQLLADLAECRTNTNILSTNLHNQINELNISLTYEINKAAEEIRHLTEERNTARQRLSEVTALYNQTVQESNEDAQAIMGHLLSTANQWDKMLEAKYEFYNKLYEMSEAVRKHVAESAKDLHDLDGSICN